jgi:hypothetical protein
MVQIFGWFSAEAVRASRWNRSSICGDASVLRLDLLLQVCQALLVSGMVRWPFLLEGSSPILEEFLLPAVEDRWLESPFIAQLRYGLLQQVPPQDGDLLLRRVLRPSLLDAFSP